jgi:hypothetical protein
VSLLDAQSGGALLREPDARSRITADCRAIRRPRGAATGAARRQDQARRPPR